MGRAPWRLGGCREVQRDQLAQTRQADRDRMMTDADNATIAVTCTRNPCRRYDPITVRITYQADIWAPIGPFKLVKADHSATRLAEKDDQ